MKIQNDPVARLKEMLNRLEQPERSSQAKDASRAGGAGAVAPGQDEVQLSPEAREMQKVRDAIAASPEVRQSIVDRLKDEIASGQYRVDGTKIADALLNEDLPV